MKYIIVEEFGSCEDLTEKVNQLIEQGWRPQGGVAVIAAPEDGLNDGYCQAMIKE